MSVSVTKRPRGPWTGLRPTADEVQSDRQDRGHFRHANRGGEARFAGGGVPGGPLPHLSGAAGGDDAGGADAGGGMGDAPPEQLREVVRRPEGGEEREVRQ